MIETPLTPAEMTRRDMGAMRLVLWFLLGIVAVGSLVALTEGRSAPRVVEPPITIVQPCPPPGSYPGP